MDSSKMVWKVIGQITKTTKTKYKPIEIFSNNELLKNPSQIANSFNDFFIDSVTASVNNIHKPKNFNPSIRNIQPDCEICEKKMG